MSQPEHALPRDGGDPSLAELYLALRGRVKLLVIVPLAVGLLSLPVTFLMPKTYTARTSFIPPQKPQSAANNALASLGPLASLAGMSAGARNQAAEQYVALLESITVSDRIIDEFGLMQVYDEKYRVEAREELEDNVHIALGKKDGLITIEVDDRQPQRAADMANRYVDELRRMASTLALTEGQQRRVFFEQLLALGQGQGRRPCGADFVDVAVGHVGRPAAAAGRPLRSVIRPSFLPSAMCTLSSSSSRASTRTSRRKPASGRTRRSGRTR